MNKQFCSINAPASAIPYQDLRALRDLVTDCGSLLRIIRMASDSLVEKERDAFRCVVDIALADVIAAEEILGGVRK